MRDYVFPMLRAGAVYERNYLLGTSVARPLIAKRQVEIATPEGADAVAHGCTGKGNDQVRFELTYMALAPRPEGHRALARVGHPLARGRARLRRRARCPGHGDAAKIYCRDRNIWHLSHEGGALEDPWNEPHETMLQPHGLAGASARHAGLCRARLRCGHGRSASMAQRLGPVDLLPALNAIGGEHGVGRIDLVENRLVGMKSRGVYETPGGTILRPRTRELEHLTLDRDDAALQGRSRAPLRRAGL